MKVIGIDPGTGKQVRKSVYATTQAECRKKLREATEAIENGTYSEPSKMTVCEWLDIWLNEYTGNVKENTHVTYETQVRVHIKPALGAVRLLDLKPHHIQAFYNRLQKGDGGNEPLSAKTIKNVNGVFHRALDQAAILGYVRQSPCIGVKLPRVIEPDMHPLTEIEMNAFLRAIKGNEYERMFIVDMFTGMRQSEIMGLTWDRIDFVAGTIFVDRQLIHEKKKGGLYKFAPTKNDKPRKLTPAPMVMKVLQEIKRTQAERRIAAGSLWNDGGFPGLVFSNCFGGHYVHNTITHNIGRIAASIGIEGLRFHDLRHTYAVASLRAGDDVKTVQCNLGHATAAFTLDRYAHYTEDMRKDSAPRMDAFMRGLEGL